MTKAKPPIHSRKDGFDVYSRADGNEYWPILDDFLNGRIEAENLKHNRSKRKVWKLEYGGRRYALKRDLMHSGGGRRLFPGGGWTFHTRVMRKVNRAVDGGCRSTPDIFLVAERWTGWLRQEAFVLMEFVEGKELIRSGDVAAHRKAVLDAVLDIQAHGLSLSDVNSRNFMIGPDGVKVIDLSCRFPDFLSMIRDSMKIKARYGLEVPIRGLVNNLFRALLSVFYKIRGRTY